MKVKAGPLDGAQPRDHVIAILRSHGCTVTQLEGDEYVIESDEFVEVLDLLDPVVSEVVVHLWRRFSNGGAWPITELVYRPPRPKCH